MTDVTKARTDVVIDGGGGALPTASANDVLARLEALRTASNVHPAGG